MEHVTFPNGAVTIAATLHRPVGTAPDARLPAVVCVHPGSSVKEQTAGIYAERLARAGFLALAFDASFQGASGGEPRHLEDPAARVEDVRCAVDHLTTREDVDPERIGVLGICAGGGYAVHAAMTDHRIRALGRVVATNAARAVRDRGDGPDALRQTLREVGEARTREARGEAPTVVPWTPAGREEAVAAGIRDGDMLEAVDYYRTPRGRHERSDNRLLLRSMASLVAFDPFHLLEDLLVQPLQVVVGDRVGEFGSYLDGRELYRRARVEKDLLVVRGAGHYDLYDRDPYVAEAVERLTAFYRAHLGAPVPA
jgi:fermentation-respiration switch protein FrsA (DUF1100 family)